MIFIYILLWWLIGAALIVFSICILDDDDFKVSHLCDVLFLSFVWPIFAWFLIDDLLLKHRDTVIFKRKNKGDNTHEGY